MPRLLTLTSLLSTLTTLSLLHLPTTQARTDLEGCTSTATRNQWNEASVLWYVPGTGEICDFPDCGGGRAPPKYDNPACPGYTGTASYEPTYLPGFGKATATATASASDDEGAATTGGASGVKPGLTGFESVSATGGAGASSLAAASPSASSRAGVTKSAATSASASASASSSKTSEEEEGSETAASSVPTSNAAAGGYARIGGGVVGVVAGVVALL